MSTETTKAVVEARVGESPPSLRSGDLLPHSLAQPKKRAFLTGYGVYGTISRAARELEIGRRTVHDWLQDPEFYDEFQLAKEEYADRLEETLLDDAAAHKLNPIERIFALKAHKREKYGDTVTVNQNVRSLVITVSRDEGE